MRFHRIIGNTCDLADLIDGIAVDELQRDAGAVVRLQQGQCGVDIHFQVGIARGCGLSEYSRRVDVVGLLPGPYVVVEDIIGNSHQPCGEAGKAPELRDVRIGLDERLLSQIVAQLFIAQCLVQEEPAHRRLVFPDKLVEGPLVVENRHLRHEGYVVEFSHV